MLVNVEDKSLVKLARIVFDLQAGEYAGEVGAALCELQFISKKLCLQYLCEGEVGEYRGEVGECCAGAKTFQYTLS